VHLYRALNAKQINDEFPLAHDDFYCKFNQGKCYSNIFDSCLVPTFSVGDANPTEVENAYRSVEDWCDGDADCLKAGTRWTLVWQTNAALMLLQSLNFILLAVGGYWFYPRLIGTFVNWVLGFCHLCIIGFTLYARFSPFGRWCSYNTAGNNGFAIETYDKLQYQYGYISLAQSSILVKDYRGDATLMLNLAIFQLSFCLIQVFCLWLPLYRTPVKDEDEQVKHQESLAKYSGIAKPGMLCVSEVEY